MKVILLHELKGRGGEGDVIDVAQGFAVNYLLPRKIAIPATSGNIKQLEHRMHNIKKREDQRIGDASSLAESLADKTVTIRAKAGEEGRLFGSVTTVMIEEAISEQLGVEIDRRKIETHGHIKTVGPHEVSVAIYRDVKAQMTVQVVAEGDATTVPATVPTTVVVEVEGTNADGEPFVDVVEETAEQAEAGTALDEAVAEASDEVAEEAAE
jgi:large subunit ribosomal protein L9